MSAFWEKKMKKYFARIDFDKDGSITQKDFDGMANRFVDSGKLKPEDAAQLKKTMGDIWGKYKEALGKGTEAITEPAFLDAMKSLVKDPTLKPTLEAPLPLFFQAVDANNDGMIQRDEFKQFFSILGLNADEADATFSAIDTNNDELLSVDEFTAAGSEFFISEDPNSPAKDFWGPVEV